MSMTRIVPQGLLRLVREMGKQRMIMGAADMGDPN